jgi:hypothetical protein
VHDRIEEDVLVTRGSTEGAADDLKQGCPDDTSPEVTA